MSPRRFRIGQIPQTISKKLEYGHRNEYSSTGDENGPRCGLQQVARAAHHRAPFSGRRGGAESQERETGDFRDDCTDIKGCRNQYGADDFRQNLYEQDLQGRESTHMGRFDVIFMAQRQYLIAHETGVLGPGNGCNGSGCIEGAATQYAGYGDGKYHRRKCQEYIGQAE